MLRVVISEGQGGLRDSVNLFIWWSGRGTRSIEAVDHVAVHCAQTDDDKIWGNRVDIGDGTDSFQ